MPARLTLFFAHRPASRHLLSEGGRYTAGRATDCDVVIDDSAVSRRHAVFFHDGTDWWIEHLDSKNGLLVDSRPCEREQLQGSVWVSFGGLLGRFEPISENAWKRERERSAERFRTSLRLQAQLAPEEGLGPLLDRTLRSMREISGAERAFIVLVTRTGELDLVAHSGLDHTSPELPGSRGAIERVLETGEPVTLSDSDTSSPLAQRPSVVRQGICALTALPLITMGRVIGVAYIDRCTPGTVFTEVDIELLTTLASHAALAIAVVRLHESVEDIEAVLPGKRTLPAAHEGGLSETTRVIPPGESS